MQLSNFGVIYSSFKENSFSDNWCWITKNFEVISFKCLD